MSFTIKGFVRSRANLSRLLEIPKQMIQPALKAAENAGLEYLKNATPVDTGLLVSTAEAHENQYSVWFSIAVNPGAPQTAFTKKHGYVVNSGYGDYGFYQEFGWHDRGGSFHPGVHMVEEAAVVATEAFLAHMGSIGGTLFRPQARYAGMGQGAQSF